jgi:hypothetical protein
MALIDEATSKGNFRKDHVRSKEVLGAFYAPVHQPTMRRLPGGLPKGACEMTGGHIDLRRDLKDRQRIGQPFDHPPRNVAEALRGESASPRPSFRSVAVGVNHMRVERQRYPVREQGVDLIPKHFDPGHHC